MPPIIIVPDTRAGMKLFRDNGPSPSLLKDIRQTDMAGIRSASDIRLQVSGANTLHLWIGEFVTCATFGIIKKLNIPVLSRKTFSDQFTNSTDPDKPKIIPEHTMPVHIIIVHKAGVQPWRGTWIFTDMTRTTWKCLQRPLRTYLQL